MKKNEQGFMLVEALIMSTVVLGILTFMYVQFQILNKNYDKSFHYNSVTNLYITNEIKDYFVNNNLVDTYKNGVNASDKKYFKINMDHITDSSFKELINKGQIKTIVLADEALSKLKGTKTSDLSEKFNDFINYLKVNKEDNKYRLLIEFQDDTYASLKIGD